MPIKLKLLPLFPILALSVSSCSEPGARTINRLDLAIADSIATPDATQIEAFNSWAEILGRPLTIESYRQSKPFKAFAPLVAEQLPPLDSVESVLGHALSQIGDEDSRLFGIIIPNKQSVVTHPSGIVLIGLNHYLGADNVIYKRFHSYERNTKDLRYLPSQVVEAILADKYPEEAPDQRTLLHEMLYQGALLQATLESMPESTPEATVLGMTDDDYEWCQRFEAKIWKTLIDRNLIYHATPSQITRLMTPAPHSTLINAQAPGQAARFIGLKIVQSYLKSNPGISAIDMLSPKYYNTNSTLIYSKYAPTDASR